MKQIWTGRVTATAGKYAEHAPMATACCNACRACVTTNIVGLFVAGATGLALSARRLAVRFTR